MFRYQLVLVMKASVLAGISICFIASCDQDRNSPEEGIPAQRTSTACQDEPEADSAIVLERLMDDVKQSREKHSKDLASQRANTRYSADHVSEDTEKGVIFLKGRAYHLQGRTLTDGRADPESSITLDARTLKVIGSSGGIDVTELLSPGK